ncbi:hypothetical protein ACF1G0_13280 [Streptomyces sp. NPDC013953]|uniref:hypothetical protein n=1 Tax=Streptomyces sp. NPDC013953 TaxID=3364868 RepID=UPI0036FB112E
MSVPHRHRFHLDQDGHSVTVLLGRTAHDVEVLVDGKVVAARHTHGRGGTELAAELPGDPPEPITLLVEDVDEVPLCVMVRGGARYLMPLVPLATEGQPHAASAVRPLRGIRRWLRALVRRRQGGTGRTARRR